MGYTAMFQELLDHPNINLVLGTAAGERVSLTERKIQFVGGECTGPVVYTGAVDELFACRLGRLPYRTLRFAFETHEKEWYQSHGTVNYTVSEAYTRITEFKHLTGQEHPHTAIVKEYSLPYTGEEGEVPYYAIISPENRRLYEGYCALAKQYPNLHLLGRLAEYQYYNMDAITLRALRLSDELLKS